MTLCLSSNPLQQLYTGQRTKYVQIFFLLRRNLKFHWLPLNIIASPMSPSHNTVEELACGQDTCTIELMLCKQMLHACPFQGNPSIQQTLLRITTGEFPEVYAYFFLVQLSYPETAKLLKFPVMYTMKQETKSFGENHKKQGHLHRAALKSRLLMLLSSLYLSWWLLHFEIWRVGQQVPGKLYSQAASLTTVSMSIQGLCTGKQDLQEGTDGHIQTTLPQPGVSLLKPPVTKTLQTQFMTNFSSRYSQSPPCLDLHHHSFEALP